MTAAIAGWIARQNRATLRGYATWAEGLARNDLAAIARMRPEEAEPRGRYLAREVARHRSYIDRYNTLADRPWYRLFMPIERPPLVPYQMLELRPR